MQKLRVGVIGVGYLGKFHAQKYARMENVELVGVVDIIRERSEKVAQALNTRAYTAYQDLFGRVDAVSVVVPTPIHFDVSRAFLENGVDVLIEKPITTTLEDANHLLQIAAKRGRLIQVGHLERYNSAVLALQDMIKRPVLIEAQRLSVFKDRALDVSVIHDLMIHDIDIILNLVKSKLNSIQAIGTPVITEHVDVANARLGFINGCVANITASRVSTRNERKISFFQKEATICVDFANHAITYTRPKANTRQGTTVPGIEIETRQMAPGDALEDELVSFTRAVAQRTMPEVTGQMGRDALKIALRIIAQINNGARCFEP